MLSRKFLATQVMEKENITMKRAVRKRAGPVNRGAGSSMYITAREAKNTILVAWASRKERIRGFMGIIGLVSLYR